MTVFNVFRGALWSLPVMSAVLALGCASGTPQASGAGEAAAASTAFVAKGSISSAMGSASFDETSVRGPRLDLSRRRDGTWAGHILDQVIDVNVYPDRLAGANLKVSISHSPRGYVIDGLVGETMVHFEVRDQLLDVSAGSKSFRVVGPGNGQYGIDGQVHFTGQAIGTSAPQPQMIFTLIGAFVPSTHGAR